MGWAWLILGSQTPQSSTCALPRGLGTWDRGAERGPGGGSVAGVLSEAGKCSLILLTIFLLFTLKLFTLKHPTTQPMGPVQTRG